MVAKLSLLGGVSFFVLIPAAVAQDQVDADDQSDIDEVVFEEILVTAQKREQSIFDVPLSVSAINGRDLAKRGVSSTEDIINQFPNVTTSAANNATANFNIRGISTDNFQGNVNRSVGVYSDDVTISHPYSGVLGVFDQERVEVLRGPQNTLNGRNTTGGAINFISRKPVVGDGTNGYGSITYGRFNRIVAEGGLGFDVTDNSAARISGQLQAQDGPFRNIAPGREGEELGKVERYALRGQYLLDVTPDTQILLQGRWALNRGTENGNIANGILQSPINPEAATAANDGVPLQLCNDIESAGVFPNPGSSCVTIFGDPASSNFRDVFNVSSAQSNIDVLGGTFRLDHNFGSVLLTSITAYDTVDVALSDDIVGVRELQAIAHQEAHHDAFQQEIRFVSDDSQAFRWIVGGYYFREDLEQSIAVRQDQNPLNPNPGILAGTQFTPFNILDQVDEDISFFAQADYDVSDRLTISGGLRYTVNDKNADSLFGIVLSPINDVTLGGPNAVLGPISGTPTTDFIGIDFILNSLQVAQDTSPIGAVRRQGAGAPPVGGPPPFIAEAFTNSSTVFGLTPDGPRLNQNTKRITGDATIRYDVTDDTNVYFRYARGFKSGAFDTRALAALAGSGASVPVGPETLNAFELGLKSSPASNVRISAAAFYYDQQGLQVFSVGPLGPQFLNVPSSRVFGVEAEVLWRLTEYTTVNVSGGWLDTEITDDGGLPGVDEGHELRNAPNFSFSSIIGHDIFIGDGRLNIGGTFRYIAEQTGSLNFDNDPLFTRPEQTYIDLTASYHFGPDEEYEISVFGRNLTGENFCAQLSSNANPINTANGNSLANIQAGNGTILADAALGQTVTCNPGNAGVPLWGVSLGVNF